MGSQPDTITKIAVRGFKSIADEQEIELHPLTLLAGANSSGKSSIMQPILLLKQTLEAVSDPGALLLNGPNVRFTSASQLLCRIAQATHKGEFAVGIDLSIGINLETVFSREEGIGFEISSMTWSHGDEKLRVLPGMAHAEINEVFNTPSEGLISGDEALGFLPLVFVELLAKLGKAENSPLCWSLQRERCFLAFEASIRDAESSRIIHTDMLSPARRFVPHLQNLIHLPGLRGNPQRTYPKRATGPRFPGTFEDYVASVISLWQSRSDPRLLRLGDLLEGMGLTWRVEAEPVDDTQVELRVGRLPHAGQGEERDLVSIADVGVGVSQSLPVVVALVAAEPGQVVYLEQPEIHLHPRAQRRLAHVLADAANRGVIVVAETHSSLLLREVQTLVATGKLATDKVKLHWFQRQEDGRTVVTPADLDENGAFGDWPEDFDEVDLDAERAYLDAVERKGAGE